MVDWSIFASFGFALTWIWDRLNEFVRAIYEFYNSRVDRLSERITSVTNIVKPLIDTGIAKVLTVVKNFSGATKKLIQATANDWWLNLLSVSTDTMKHMGSVSASVWERIKGMSADIWDWLKDHARSVIEGVRDTATSAWDWVQKVGADLKQKVLWIWDDIKFWYAEHLEVYVKKIKPYIIGINAALTLTNNVVLLKKAIQSGRIEQIFRQTIELFTSTTAEIASALHSEILSSVAQTSTMIIQKVHEAVSPLKEFVDRAEMTIGRVANFLPIALMDKFGDILTFIDKTTQPFINALSMVERETRLRLSYMRMKYRYSFLDNLRPAMSNTRDFSAQIQFWQFLIGRILNNI